MRNRHARHVSKKQHCVVFCQHPALSGPPPGPGPVKLGKLYPHGFQGITRPAPLFLVPHPNVARHLHARKTEYWRTLQKRSAGAVSPARARASFSSRGAAFCASRERADQPVGGSAGARHTGFASPVRVKAGVFCPLGVGEEATPWARRVPARGVCPSHRNGAV